MAAPPNEREPRAHSGRANTRSGDAAGLPSTGVDTPCCLSAPLCSFWECISTLPTTELEHRQRSYPCATVLATDSLHHLSYGLIPKPSDRIGTGLLWSRFYLCVQSKVAWRALMSLLCAHHFKPAHNYQGTGNGCELGRHPQNCCLLWGWSLPLPSHKVKRICQFLFWGEAKVTHGLSFVCASDSVGS